MESLTEVMKTVAYNTDASGMESKQEEMIFLLQAILGKAGYQELDFAVRTRLWESIYRWVWEDPAFDIYNNKRSTHQQLVENHLIQASLDIKTNKYPDKYPDLQDDQNIVRLLSIHSAEYELFVQTSNIRLAGNLQSLYETAYEKLLAKYGAEYEGTIEAKKNTEAANTYWEQTIAKQEVCHENMEKLKSDLIQNPELLKAYMEAKMFVASIQDKWQVACCMQPHLWQLFEVRR